MRGYLPGNATLHDTTPNFPFIFPSGVTYSEQNPIYARLARYRHGLGECGVVPWYWHVPVMDSYLGPDMQRVQNSPNHPGSTVIRGPGMTQSLLHVVYDKCPMGYVRTGADIAPFV